MADFEEAAVSAFREYGDVNVAGCWFGMKDDYRHDDDTVLCTAYVLMVLRIYN